MSQEADRIGPIRAASKRRGHRPNPFHAIEPDGVAQRNRSLAERTLRTLAESPRASPTVVGDGDHQAKVRVA